MLILRTIGASECGSLIDVDIKIMSYPSIVLLRWYTRGPTALVGQIWGSVPHWRTSHCWMQNWRNTQDDIFIWATDELHGILNCVCSKVYLHRAYGVYLYVILFMVHCFARLSMGRINYMVQIQGLEWTLSLKHPLAVVCIELWLSNMLCVFVSHRLANIYVFSHCLR